MKKKILTGILEVSMLGLVLVGCGGNKEVTKTDESQVEITTEKESETVAEEVTEVPTEVETEASAEVETETPTEVETEAPTEEVKADFLAENGLTVTPNGSMTIPLAVKDSDNMIDVPITTVVETVASSEEGYSDTTLKVDIDAKAAAGQYYTCNVSAFDRYTGVSYESKPTNLGTNNGSMHENVVVVDVDGTQYDCALTADMNMDSNYVQHVTVTVHHPSNYDGVVFVFGGMTATQKASYNAIDSNNTYTIADYSDVFIEGQYFFTATDK